MRLRKHPINTDGAINFSRSSITLLCVIVISACGEQMPNTDASPAQDSEAGDSQTDDSSSTQTGSTQDDFDTSSIATPIGGCVISNPVGEVPEDLYSNSGIVQTEAYLPFTKIITVRGITLMGQDDNTDAFMLKVAQAVEEIFPENDSTLDAVLQARVIRSMYERKTVIPFFKGDGGVNFSGVAESQFDIVQDNNSLCDAIFEYGGQGQTMEVVEHILHHVTMVGLHYTFFDDWGVNRESGHYTQMQTALSSGYYNGDYGSQSSNEMMRIYLQEYAYWVISSAWDVQQAYGGDMGGGEWTLGSPAALSSSQPEMYEIYERTVARVMKAPGAETLAWFQN